MASDEEIRKEAEWRAREAERVVRNAVELSARRRRQRDERMRAWQTETALADVLSGHMPSIAGREDIGVVMMEDESDRSKQGPESYDKKMPPLRPKLVNLQNDPIGHMRARNRIDDVQLRGARDYQRFAEQAEIGGARGIDISKERVNGGKFAEPDTDRSGRARDELLRIDTALGEYGRDLIRLVLVEKKTVTQVAQMWGLMAQWDLRSLHKEFTRYLEKIAEKRGYAPARPARGPQRKYDGYDGLAVHADNPRLHTAIRAAREA